MIHSPHLQLYAEFTTKFDSSLILRQQYSDTQIILKLRLSYSDDSDLTSARLFHHVSGELTVCRTPPLRVTYTQRSAATLNLLRGEAVSVAPGGFITQVFLWRVDNHQSICTTAGVVGFFLSRVVRTEQKRSKKGQQRCTKTTTPKKSHTKRNVGWYSSSWSHEHSPGQFEEHDKEFEESVWTPDSQILVWSCICGMFWKKQFEPQTSRT